MRLLAAPFLLLLVTGCAGDLQRLHDLHPEANDFQSSLASEYEAYADSEAEQGRSLSAEHYAAKGLKALKGEAVEPEPADGTLSAESQQELADARAQLMKVMTDDVKRVNPQQLAHAQLLFDCWQHQLSRDLNQDKAPCADEFRSTFSQLQDVADPLVYGKLPKHIIVFAHKSKALDEEGMKTVKEVAALAAAMPRYRVQLEAYIGRKSSQRRLTEARLIAVRRALIKEGVHERAIHIKREGGAKAVVLSGDKARDTKKVIITVKASGRTRE